MQFNSIFSIGDKVWVIDGSGIPREVTVGQVRVCQTDSPGCGEETIFDNYKPQKNYTEEYMCVETGIGSGNVYKLGKSIFATEQECASAIAAFNS